MSEKLRITAKTVEEAIKKASDIWKIDANEVGYDVIQTPSKGIFGIGSKDAIIEINKNGAPVKEEKEAPRAPQPSIKEEAPVVAEAPAAVVKEDYVESAEDIGLAFLAPILKSFEVNPVITVTETDETIRFEANGEKVGILIGRRGETLNAIQFLMSLVINSKLEKHKGVIFDVENYRARQVEKLEDIAKRMAQKCRKTGKRVTLNPMNPAERRIIHITLEKEAGVTSYSEGNEPNRRIVIIPE